MNAVEEKRKKQLSNANKQKICKVEKKIKKIECKKSSWQDTQAKSLDCLAHNNDLSCSRI
jgi:hypothetical protein